MEQVRHQAEEGAGGGRRIQEGQGTNIEKGNRHRGRQDQKPRAKEPKSRKEHSWRNFRRRTGKMDGQRKTAENKKREEQTTSQGSI